MLGKIVLEGDVCGRTPEGTRTATESRRADCFEVCTRKKREAHSFSSPLPPRPVYNPVTCPNYQECVDLHSSNPSPTLSQY